MNTAQLNWFDRLMISMTFAEAGERDTALRYLKSDRAESGILNKNRARKQVQEDNRPRMSL